MSRGQAVGWELTANSKGFVGAALAASGSLDKVNASAARTSTVTNKLAADNAKLASSFSQVAGNVSRYGAAMGVPTDALRVFAAAEDAASLGAKNLSKSMAGLNAASVGVAGAGLALGYAIGTWLRSFDAVEKAADKAGEAIFRMLTGQHDTGGTVGAQWGKNQALIHAAARQKQLAGMIAGGASVDQIKEVFTGKAKTKDPILLWIEEQEKKAKDQEAAAKRWEEQQKRALATFMEAWKKFQEMQDEIERSFREMPIAVGGTSSTVGSGPMMMHGLGRMPGEGSLAGMNNVLPSHISREQMNVAEARQAQLNAGASLERQNAGRPAGVSFGTTFSEGFQASIKNLPNVILAAFQGGGNVGASIGASVGGSLAGSLAKAAGPALGKMFGSTIGGAVGSAIPIVGTLLGGALGGLVGGLFGGGPSKEELEQQRKERAAEQRRIRESARTSRLDAIDNLGSTGSAFFGGRTILTADDAQRSGTVFVDAWTQVVKEKGIDVAADAFGDAFAKMKADIEKAGIEMPAWMQAIEAQMGLGKNEAFRAASGQGRNAAAFLGALGGAGGLSPDSFRAFEQEARAVFAAGQGAAAEAGLGTEEATKAGFAAANPLLQGLLNQSILTGQSMSADIQALIDQAGIVPEVDIQQLDELRQIRAAVQALAGTGFAGGGTGGHGQINPDIYADLPQMEGGGRRAPGSGGGGGSPVVIHDDETVVPDEDAGDWARAVLGQSSNSGSVDSALGAIRAELKALRGQGPPLTVQNQLVVDTSGLGRNNQEAFLQQMDERVSRAFEPGSPNYRRLVKAIKRHSGG